MTNTRAPAPPSRRAPLTLLGLALAESALSLYQWAELHKVRAGGVASCSINQTLNCETVWNTPFATALHALTGLPVAGLGLAWGLVGVALALVLLARTRAAGDVRAPANGLRLWALAGLAAALVFAGVSLSARALCLTCLGTYALVLASAAAALLLLPRPALPQPGEWGRALALPAGLALAALLLLQLPGRATPRYVEPRAVISEAPAVAPTAPTSAPQAEGTPLERYLKALPRYQQEAIADGLEEYRAATPRAPLPPPRALKGAASAPVHLVEWTDVKCPACKRLVLGLGELRRLVPGSRLAIESRQYPLDGQCNPGLHPGDGLRCDGARALLCVEGAPDAWELQQKLFTAQESLTQATLLDILSSGVTKRDALERCMTSPETGAKLQQDIADAKAHGIHGTPHVLVNGREAPAYVPLLYTLAAVGGDADDPQLRVLPQGRPPPTR